MRYTLQLVLRVPPLVALQGAVQQQKAPPAVPGALAEGQQIPSRRGAEGLPRLAGSTMQPWRPWLTSTMP